METGRDEHESIFMIQWLRNSVLKDDEEELSKNPLHFSANTNLKPRRKSNFFVPKENLIWKVPSLLNMYFLAQNSSF